MKFYLPPINRLILVQSALGAICLISFIGLSLFSIRTAETKQRTAIEASVRPLFKNEAEKWVAWREVGLEEALQQELNELKKLPHIERVELVGVAEREPRVPRNVILFPAATESAISGYRFIVVPNLSAGAQLTNETLRFYGISVLIGFIICSLIVTGSALKSQIRNLVATLESALEKLDSGLPPFESDARTPELERMLVLLRGIHSRTERSAKNAAFAGMATQVAHDIRSPLAALEVGIRDSVQLPEETRTMIRGAVNRIRDIANDLLDRHRIENGDAAAGSFASDAVTPNLVPALLDAIISEKRYQHSSSKGVEIDLHLESKSYGLFASVNEREFKRLISNLVNNSVEAIERDGRVDIYLAEHGSCLEMRVEDNGRGIASEILPEIMREGKTYGKSTGSGLGLHHARVTVESWGGTIEINSALNVGTTVTLRLPRAAAPDWFVASIQVPSGGTVVIVDDDPSIRAVWSGRFEALHALTHNVNIFCFASPSELGDWIGSASKRIGSESPIVYLCDFEFSGQGENGLEMIERLGIAAHSILVTSRYDEVSVRKMSKRLGVKQIPKGMVGLVPIEFGAVHDGCDVVLIDDDPLVHELWAMESKRCQKRIRMFATARDFYAAAAPIRRDTPIYIDYHLGTDLDGAGVAEVLFSQGFSALYIATGISANEVPPAHWIKGIVGKEPPRWC